MLRVCVLNREEHSKDPDNNNDNDNNNNDILQLFVTASSTTASFAHLCHLFRSPSATATNDNDSNRRSPLRNNNNNRYVVIIIIVVVVVLYVSLFDPNGSGRVVDRTIIVATPSGRRCCRCCFGSTLPQWCRGNC